MRSGGRHTWVRLAWRACGLLALSLGLLAHAPTAHAQTRERVQDLLRVEAGATCLRADKLTEHVELWLLDAPIERGVTVVVRGSATELRSARLLVQRDGQTVAHRAFEPGPARCENLHAAIGLAIALALKVSLDDVLGEPLPDDPSARDRAWSLAGAALWTMRTLPASAPGIDLSLRRGLGRHLMLRLGAMGAFAGDVALDAGLGRFDALLATTRAELCIRTRLDGVLGVAGCVGLAGGLLHAAGTDVSDPDSSVAGWSAASNALELELSLSPRWALALGGSASFLLHRVEVGLEASDGRRFGRRRLEGVGFAVGLGPVYYF